MYKIIVTPVYQDCIYNDTLVKENLLVQFTDDVVIRTGVSSFDGFVSGAECGKKLFITVPILFCGKRLAERRGLVKMVISISRRGKYI